MVCSVLGLVTLIWTVVYCAGTYTYWRPVVELVH